MKFYKSEISRRVLAITILPAVLVAVLLSLASSIVQTSAMERSLSERGMAIVRQLAPASEYGVYSANQDILRPLVESVMKEPDVISVEVRDVNGVLLIRSGGGSLDAGNSNMDITGVSKEYHQNSWKFYAPIYQSEFNVSDYSGKSKGIDAPKSTLKFTERVLGWVSIEISLEESKSLQTRIWINTAVIAFSVLLFGGLIALRMGKSITSPITKLMHAVKEVESGRLDIHIESGASGELKSLEEGINKMAKALKESREELEIKIEKATQELRVVLDELATNNSELEMARCDAERAIEEKSAFLANISHEIRTPLHGVQGFMQLLYGTSLQDEQKVYIDRMNTSVKTLSSLLNDILDFSRLEVSKLKIEYGEFSVFSLVDDVVNVYALEANKKNLELIGVIDSEVPECLYGSVDRLSQVLRNLVSNAIKFTLQGDVTIRIEKLSGEDDCLFRITVRDTGIGIRPAERGRLFQPFSQLESGMKKNYGGVGLGLVISKALVELMGGRIFVNSIESVGTSFSIEMSLPQCESAIESLVSDEVPLGWILSPNANVQIFLQQALLRWNGIVLARDFIPQAKEDIPSEIRSSNSKILMIVDGHYTDLEISCLLELLSEMIDAGKVVAVLLEGAEEYEGRVDLCRLFTHRLKRPLTNQDMQRLLNKVMAQKSQIESRQGALDQASHTIPPDRLPGRVLLADDNVINREFLNIWMTKAGVLVDEAKNGIEALLACEKKTYDLILMDLHMPEMDGFQAITTIRRGAGKNAKSRIIAITADATEDAISGVIASGFDDLLIKPVAQERLLSVLTQNSTSQVEIPPSAESQAENGEENPLVVDEVQGIKYASGNEALWHWSLKTLYMRLPQYQSELKAAAQSSDQEELRKLLHAIHGAAAYCGATDLISSIRRVQVQIKRDHGNGFELDMTALLDSISEFQDWMVDRGLG